ncbi:hypothetical protein BsWGS_14565 [Bradybaena similaris]
MSYPGRAPMGMPGGLPGMAPRIMPQGYPFTSMSSISMQGMNPMMPVQMGMMAPMMRPINMMAPQLPQIQMQQQQQQQMKQNKTILVPQEIPKTDGKEDKPPVTTVFVGNISERAPDMMIKQMLQRCGNVIGWKRVQGASGKLQAFGFCEYEDPEATLRCIRLLNEWQIADKKLMVKVDTKTKTLLDEYRKKQKATSTPVKTETPDSADKKEESDEKEEKEKSEDTTDEPADELDEDTKREDRVAAAGLEAIMKEYAFELAKEPLKPPEPAVEKDKPLPKKDKELLLHAKDTGFEDMDLEDDKREIINREIHKFRDRHKDDDDEKDKDKERERNMIREREQQRKQEEKRHRERMERLREQRERELNRDRERERDRDRDRVSTRASRSRSHSPSPVSSRSRKRSRSREMTSRDRSRERRKEKEIEEEEEAYERRKLEKKLREKEAAYQERLKTWEGRERKKAREHDKEKEREEERKSEEAREARRLKEFLEDYDDLKDDPKFYKGSALMRRLKEREKEKELDNRDRQREKEEFEEIKRKLFDDGHPDAETEVARMEREREEHLQPCLHLQEIKPPEPVVSSSESESDVEPPVETERQHTERQRSERQHSDRQHSERQHTERQHSERQHSERQHTERQHTERQHMERQHAERQHAEKQHTERQHTERQLMERQHTERQLMERQLMERQLMERQLLERQHTERQHIERQHTESPKIAQHSRIPSLAIQHKPSPPLSTSPVSTDSRISGPGPGASPDSSSLPGVPALVDGKRKTFTVGDVFNQDDDDSMEPKKRKLIPLDYDDDKSTPTDQKLASAEDKRQRIKQLIESIPTAKEELYAYTVDWEIVDQNLMDKRIKPWVTKKIIEYIGEEEPTLTEFICQKVVARSTPQSIQNDVAMILDEEAEVFVVKMWRLLVYETEAKKLGLVK